MLRTLARLCAKIATVFRVCGPGRGLAYLVAVGGHAREILHRRDLQPADKAMRGAAEVRFRGARIAVPFEAVDAANSIPGDGPTFASIREIFGDAVYLRGFREIGPVGVFVDLGANRGMVSLMGAKALGAEVVVAVEPQVPYGACFEILADANRLGPEQRHRIGKMAGAVDDEATVSVAGLMAAHGLDRIDFLKCDIEGGETALVLDGPPFLDRVGLMAMELHPEAGVPTAELVARAEAAGLTCRLTDPDGHPAEAARAGYLYAARDPERLA